MRNKSKRVKSSEFIRSSEFTAVKMEAKLYDEAKRRAKGQHQTYSEYVRQLIVRDIQQKAVTR